MTAEAKPFRSSIAARQRSAVRRAAVRAEISQQRERLAHGARPTFEYELLAMFARNERQALVTVPTLAVISVFAILFWAPNALEALGWCALVISTKFFMTEACRQFLMQPRSVIRLDAWRRRLTFIEFVSGLGWAGMALVGATSTRPEAHVFVLAALIVLLAVRMTFAATVTPILYAGTIPMTIAVFLRLIMQGTLFHYAMAFMALGLQIYFMALARDLCATSQKLLASRAEADDLVAELEQQKSISDEARNHAEDANLAKSRFLATMSHELRTPLNAILGFSEVMHSELFGPMQNAQYREYAGNIHDSGKHLLQLINEILDLSRIEAGRYELHEVPVRLGDVITDCCRLLKLRADGKGLTVVVDVAKGIPPILADERAVRQICLNLLSNAVKFTPRGGRITVSAKLVSGGGQRLAVQDNGPGIPKDEIPKVLQAFGQGSLAHQTAEGGTGLGLSIVQSLIGLHGGRFDLASELRKGTTASVEFPANRVVSVAAVRPDAGHRVPPPAATSASTPASPLGEPPREPIAAPATTSKPPHGLGSVAVPVPGPGRAARPIRQLAPATIG